MLKRQDTGMTAEKNRDVDFARKVFELEAAAVRGLADRIDEGFAGAVGAVLDAGGRVVVTGMGKAGIIGEKISATLSSTGTPSFWMHPVEAIHGDLGRIVAEDVVLVLSNSGETAEVARLIGPLRRIGSKIIAITAQADSTLGREADFALTIGELEEACPLGLAPSASTTAMLAMGDALALAVLERRGFSKEEFAFFHPGGSLGRSLMKVSELMRSGESCPVLPESATVREVIAAITAARAGAAALVDADGRLTGIFTDGDLRRYLVGDKINLASDTVGDFMVKNPRTAAPDELVEKALGEMQKRKIGEMPVVDARGRVIGMINLKDCLGIDST
jgi:arabinose-5-phosphate isomerase